MCATSDAHETSPFLIFTLMWAHLCRFRYFFVARRAGF